MKEHEIYVRRSGNLVTAEVLDDGKRYAICYETLLEDERKDKVLFNESVKACMARLNVNAGRSARNWKTDYPVHDERFV